MPWALILDGLLAVLLLLTIVYAFVLNRRLGLLRSDRGDLEEFIRRFHDATAKADASLKGLRGAAEANARLIKDATEKAQALRDELAFLVERADSSAERLAKSSSRPVPPMPSEDGDTASGEDASGAAPGSQASEPRARRDRSGQPSSGGRPKAEPGAEGAPGSEAERDLLNALRRAR